jgi:hypothetical protein
MGRVMILSLVLFGVMIQPLLDHELDFGVYQERPNVTVEPVALDQLSTGFDQWYQEQDRLEKESPISSEKRTKEATPVSWEVEQQRWENENAENGLFGC